jgi:hypothetical protein
MAAAAPAPVNQFDVARKRAAQQEASNAQQAGDAIKRRMASMGGGPSGAMVKLEGQARDESAKRLATANEGIDMAETAENRRIAEIKEGRDFQRGEREASQTWQGAEADKGRLFTRGEREATQGFARGEREASQTFASGEREASQTFAAGQQDKQIKAQFDMQTKQIEAAALEGRLSREQADKALAETKRQYDQDLIENKKTNYINSVLSAHNSKMPPEEMRKLLDGLGVTFAPDGSVSITAPTTTGVTAPTPPPAKVQPPANAVDVGNGIRRSPDGRRWQNVPTPNGWEWVELK